MRAISIDSLESIRDIFSILHDGVTSEWNVYQRRLTLKVDCGYLATIIDPSYQYFYVELSEINKLELVTAMNRSGLPKDMLKTIEGIFQTPLQFTATVIEDDYVRISCNQLDTHAPNSSELLLNCNEIKVYDHEHNELTVDELYSVSHKYWDHCYKELGKTLFKKLKA